jgi:hypothetical protein
MHSKSTQKMSFLGHEDKNAKEEVKNFSKCTAIHKQLNDISTEQSVMRKEGNMCICRYQRSELGWLVTIDGAK